MLTSYKGQSISYDSIGNPTSYLGRTLSWEKGRQLKSNLKDGTKSYYTYDVNGLRTQKKVGSTTHGYTYQNGQLLAYEEGNNQMMFSYDETGNPLGLWYNGSKYYYQTNLQGDVVGIINDSGFKIASYSYDAWGKPIGTIPSSGVGAVNPLRYRGYVYDMDTGFYYVSSRYYDPETGRFLNADTPEILFLDQGTLLQYNLYAYCFNNSVNNTDLAGYMVNPRWKMELKVSYGKAASAIIQTAGKIFIVGFAITAAAGLVSYGAPMLFTVLKPLVINAIGAGILNADKLPEWLRKVLGVVNKNDLNHIFGKAGHHLGAFLKSLGGNQARAYYWVQNAINREKLPNGVFKDIPVKVNGYTIYVRGMVINGVKHISTFFIKK